MKFDLQEQTVNNHIIETVSARDIWIKLESKKDFSSWIKNRIEQSGFEEDIDYIKLTQKGELSTTGQNKIEYYASLNMGKHLGMMERNDKGKEVRQYFIDKENEPVEPLSVDMIAALATQMGKDQRKLIAIEAQNAKLKTRAKNIENVIDSEVQRINTDINQLQVDSQNGVPLGYISKSNAYHLYGQNFAKGAFHKLMAGMPVRNKKYIHTEAGHSSHTKAYHTNDVIIAIKDIKNNIIQLSAHRATCSLIPNSNFRYK